MVTTVIGQFYTIPFNFSHLEAFTIAQTCVKNKADTLKAMALKISNPA
jgi:hypothetical protein